ncbi:MAG TPA: L-threonylcarbamoyladenylate synthase [Candidatus Limnocylindrales bacterium]|nr:L-threonylcarbamoyladenylate synthase [Candidatus Limnocylindrales bacterium]
MTARILPDDDAGRAEAVRVLRAGGIVAMPTDTVYGIGVAWAASPDAIERLFAAKRRPAERAIVLLLATTAQARELATWPPAAERLAASFWPGGLTLVVPQGVPLPPELTGGRPTIGLRVPDHDCPRALAATLGLAVTSANLSGQPDASDADEVRRQLGDAVDLILDGGPVRGGTASTVVDCSGAEPRILREGAISAAAIERVLGGTS